jgi:hypothetical protein
MCDMDCAMSEIIASSVMAQTSFDMTYLLYLGVYRSINDERSALYCFPIYVVIRY